MKLKLIFSALFILLTYASFAQNDTTKKREAILWYSTTGDTVSFEEHHWLNILVGKDKYDIMLYIAPYQDYKTVLKVYKSKKESKKPNYNSVDYYLHFWGNVTEVVNPIVKNDGTKITFEFQSGKEVYVIPVN